MDMVRSNRIGGGADGGARHSYTAAADVGESIAVRTTIPPVFYQTRDPDDELPHPFIQQGSAYIPHVSHFAAR